MRLLFSNTWTYKAIVLIIIIAIACYVLPIFIQITKFDFSVLSNGVAERNCAWLRSTIFSFISSLFNVFCSLWLAIHLRKFTLFSKRGTFLSLLILPALMGDVSIAFIGKVLLANSTILHENSIFKFISLILIQFWQYGTLFTYIFWLVIQSIKEPVNSYSIGVKMTNSEYLKDVILPSTKNIAVLIFVLNFIFAFFENAKSQFIFRASRGTNSEFISRWLEKYYQSNTLFNIDTAITHTLQLGAATMLSVLLLIILMTIMLVFFYKGYLTSKYYLPSIRSEIFSNILYIAVLFLLLSPIAWIILELVFTTTFSLDHLFPVIVITFIASIISTFLSIQIGILLRLAWKTTMSTFSNKSLIFYSLILIILLFPPLVLYILGFKWLSVIGYQNSFLIKCVWVIGHVLLVLPILSSFIAVTHYRTTNYEIEFIDSYKLNYQDKIRVLFNRRYLLDYSLTLFIAFSFIWNESTINNLLSDFVPSFISEMKMSISGRGTDYSSGIGYFFVSLSLAFLSIALWNFIVGKIKVKIM